MKTLAVTFLLVAIIGFALAIVDLKDGRPGCKTDAEIQKKYYRNFWDANAYWVCKSKGQAAVLERCEEGGYQDSVRKCVNWDDWEWEEPVAPPSVP